MRYLRYLSVACASLIWEMMSAFSTAFLRSVSVEGRVTCGGVRPGAGHVLFADGAGGGGGGGGVRAHG